MVPWTDITSNRTISISQNVTVYIRATDLTVILLWTRTARFGVMTIKKLTLIVSLSDGVYWTIQASDTVSGIASITVNGTEHTDLSGRAVKDPADTEGFYDQRKIENFCKNFGRKCSIPIPIPLQNPYYEWAVKQAIAQSADSQGSTTTSGENTEVTSPSPQDSTPRLEPTSSTGTVTDRTVTGIEEQLANQNETVDTISSTTTPAAGKEFYTIFHQKRKSVLFW